MHLPPFVLLAVLSNPATAGLVRYNSRLNPRFLNSTSAAAHTTLPISLPNQQHKDGSPTSSIASKQVGSVPAFGDGPGAATTVSESHATAPLTTSHIPTASIIRLSQQGDSSPSSSPAASKQVGSVPAFGNGPGAATQESAPPSATSTRSSFQAFSPVSHANSGNNTSPTQSVATQQSVEPGVPTISLDKTFAGTATPSSSPKSSQSSSQKASQPAPSAASPSSIAPKPASQANVTAENGNIAMALGFNSAFASMSADSPCDAKNPSEVTACINGQWAQCGNNGKYTLAACPQGLQCYALPLAQGAKGITVQCASLQAANQQLGQDSQPAQPASASPAVAPQPEPSSTNTTPTALVSPGNSPTTQSQSTSSATTTAQGPSTSATTQSASKPSGSPSTLISQPNVPSSISTTTAKETTTTSVAANPSNPNSPTDGSTATAKETTTTTVAASPSKPTKSANSSTSTTGSAITTTAVPSSFKPTASQGLPTTATKDTSTAPAAASPSDDPIIISIPQPTPSSLANKVVPQPIKESSEPSASAPSITEVPSYGNGLVTVTDFITVTTTVHDRR